MLLFHFFQNREDFLQPAWQLEYGTALNEVYILKRLFSH